MKTDEFAFFNQQLAGMLRSGIPLEGALRELCGTMRRGRLKSELQILEEELAKGVPLGEAVSRRQLPPLYTEMIKVGVQSNNLPAILTLLADYYRRVHLTWTKLKGLIIYPAIVLMATLALSVFVAIIYSRFIAEMDLAALDWGQSAYLPHPVRLAVNLWFPVGLLLSGIVVMVVAISLPPCRRALRWRMPAFKEARLSQMASALALMLENGCSLNQSLNLLRQLEAGEPVDKELALWQARLASGHRKIAELAAGGKIIPPMFVWLVAGSGEDWAGGFRHAAEIYHARALQRQEILIYAALPVSVLALGFLIMAQISPMARMFLGLARALAEPVSMMD